ncbi:hypothetical protein E4T52_06852 [Aureobasidium sp. EXF-3400]|nr:hypothetical protein E4T51_14057 [Aureobasidium sp. EXF-12344]KAI4778195.1 hypothetical protein E4T52_06852 [Aureobasidium sp. EXF-3400]
MSSPINTEKHITNNDLMRNFIIGFSDGLTVPFALTSGLSSLGSSRLVVLAGLAELFSGAISMGLSSFLAASTDAAQYAVEMAREKTEIEECPLEEEQEIYDIFAEYGIERCHVFMVVERLKQDPEMWVKFMMDFELKLTKPNRAGAWIEGGILPMIPYFAFKRTNDALFTSIGITVVILIVFGYGKSAIVGNPKKDSILSACYTLIVGVVAAGTSYGIVRGLDSANPVRA